MIGGIKVKRLLIFGTMLMILSVAIFGEISMGGGVAREFGGLNRTMLEGRLTFENPLSFEIAGQLLTSNPASQVQFYTYANLNFTLSHFQLYIGLSPNWFVSSDGFSLAALLANGYLHAGLGFKYSFIRVYGEIIEPIVYVPLSLGADPMADIGIQYCF